MDGKAKQGTRQGRKRLDEEWMEWQGKAQDKFTNKFIITNNEIKIANS